MHNHAQTRMITQYLATLVATTNESQGIYGSSHPAGKLCSGDTSAVALLERLHGHRILGESRRDPSASSARLGSESEVQETRILLVS
jgi:hypothetical protein